MILATVGQSVTRGQAEYESKSSRRKEFAEPTPVTEAAVPAVESVPE
jgi:hypothetical protein